MEARDAKRDETNRRKQEAEETARKQGEAGAERQRQADAAEQRRLKEEKRQEAIRANPCQICRNEMAAHECPACRKKCGSNCWNAGAGTCMECKQKKDREEVQKQQAEATRLAAIHANPCQICNKEVGNHSCPDCDRKVGDTCWNSNLAICTPCANKLKVIAGGATAAAPATPSQTPSGLPDSERLFRLKSAFQMAPEVPLAVLAKSLQFASPEDFTGWLFGMGMPGPRADFATQVLRLADPDAFAAYLDGMLGG